MLSAFTWSVSAQISGDFDGNGTVNINDVMVMLKGITDESVELPSSADMNADGSVDVTDALTLLKAVTQQGITATPVESKDKWEESIKNANNLKNNIVQRFTDSNRTAFLIENSHVSIEQSMKAGKAAATISSPSGAVYAENTFDAYMTDTNGKTYYGAMSTSNGRMNAYRMGYYFTDVHILDLMLSGDEENKIESAFDILAQNPSLGSNQTSTPRIRNGELTFNALDTYDPYVHMYGFSTPIGELPTVEITIKTDTDSLARLYVIAGSHPGYSEAQALNFSVVGDGQYHTYSIPVYKMDDFTGTLRGIRIDIGARTNQYVAVSSLKLVSKKAAFVPVMLDKTFYTYADKMHCLFRFVASGKTENIAQYGCVLRIDKDTVDKLTVCDANGTRSHIDGIDEKTAEYVGFDIKNAGVLGFIIPNRSAVSVKEEGESYVVKIYTDVTKSELVKGGECSVPFRLYTDESHSFDELTRQSYIERNPLKVTAENNEDGATYIEYDATVGAYRFSLGGTDFNTAYYTAPQKHFSVTPTVTGDSEDRSIYIYTKTVAGGLECAAVLDENKNLLPIATQVSKNFAGENEEPFYYVGDKGYGETIIPLTVNKDEQKKFTVLNLYQNWGKFPLKQLSSIQFFISYYHLSVGVTETNCISPYYIEGRDGWVLPDFRGLSSELWPSQPQHYTFGRLYFLKYNQNGKVLKSEYLGSNIKSSGPVYVDIDSEYLSDDGKIKVKLSHIEMPQTDETRTYYRIRLDFLDSLSVDNARTDFSVFSADGRICNFQKLTYTDSSGAIIRETLNYTNHFTKNMALGKTAPFFALWSPIGQTQTVNLAVLIRSFDAVIGGAEYGGELSLRSEYKGGFHTVALTLDEGAVTFKKGDYIDVYAVLMPWGDYYETTDDKVIAVRNDSLISPYKIEVAVGADVTEMFLPAIAAENSKAQFTISGGRNNAAVRIDGFADYVRPTIYELVNGQWQVYDTSYYGYDGIQVLPDGNGTYSFSFAIDMADGAPRTIKVEQ